MQETELIKLASQGKLVLVPAGADIVVLDKFPYTDLVDPSTLEFVNMKEHTPAWAQQAKNYHMPQPKADVQTKYTSHSQPSMSKPEEEDEEDILAAENEIPASPIPPEPQQTEPPTAKEQICSAPKQEASEAKQKKMQEQFVSSSNVVSGSDDFSDF